MSFSASINGFAKRAGLSVEKTARAVELRLFRAVILDTPVDSGRLRGEWQASSGSPVQTQSGIEDPSGATAVSSAKAVIDAIKGGSVTFLTNNMPYAYRIEFDGWSKIKAPEGMVRKNVARFKSLLDEEARKNRV